MKNLVLVGALALMGFGFTSCKKDYNCKCTLSLLSSSTDTTFSIGKVERKDAETICAAKTIELELELAFEPIDASCVAKKNNKFLIR